MKKIINTIITSGMIIVIGNFINQGLTFISAPLFSKLMQPDDFGLFSSFIAFVQIIQILFTLNIQNSLYNAKIDFSEYKNRLFLKNISIFIIFNSMIIIIMILIFSKSLMNIFKINSACLYLGCIYTFFYSFYLLINSYLISNKDNKKNTVIVSIITFIYSLLNIVFSLILVYYLENNKYIGRVYGMLLSVLLIFPYIVYYIYNNTRLSSFSLYSFFKSIKYGLTISIPLIFHSLSSIVLSKMDQLMLLNTISAYSAGIYSYGNNFSHIFSTITQAFNTVYMPWYLGKKANGDLSTIKKTYLKYRKFIFLIFCIFNLCIPEVIYILSAREYYKAINSIQIVCLGFFFNYMYFFIVNYETYYKKTIYIAIGTILSGIINLVLNYFFIPFFQDVGAATATMISYFCLLIFHLIIAKYAIKEDFEFDIKDILFYCILASLVMLLSIYFRNNYYLRYILVIAIVLYIAITLKKRLQS